jgi:CheY-like chemotaxis protein
MKILHIDDHQLSNEGLNAVFSQYSTKYQIISATNAEQALDALTQNSDVELILIDLNMSGINGLTFIDSINERNIFIPKAYNCQKILGIIEQVMLGRTYVPDNILEGKKSLSETPDLQDEYKILTAYKLG